MSEPVLEVNKLSVTYSNVTVVRDLSFQLLPAETLALSGSSGSGKSSVLSALMGLASADASITGSATINGVELLGADDRALQRVRGRVVAMVAQDPGGWMNPVRRIGSQIDEAIKAHQSLSRQHRKELIFSMLERVGLDSATAKRFPHECSGGMLQRAALAMALINQPRVLLADEPTSALDSVVQAEVLDLIRDVQQELQLAVVLVTHDRRVVKRFADHEINLSPAPASSRPLRRPAPRLFDPSVDMLQINNVTKRYGDHVAVDDVSFSIDKGETLALVGRTGSGKSTLARLICGLEHGDTGTLTVEGNDWFSLRKRDRQRMHQRVQMTMQDSYASLDPRLTVRTILEDPLRAHGLPVVTGAPGSNSTAADLLRLVELPVHLLDRKPKQLSGGQRARVSLARALSLRPALVVLDEPLASVDHQARSQLLDLLVRLQAATGIAYLYITHDLDTVRHVAHRVAVMLDGRIVETGAVDEVLDTPAHIYTRDLVEAGS